VRYGTRWTGTKRDGERFTLATTDGEYRTRVPVFAFGIAEPWKPDIPGIADAGHYADTRAPETYAGKRIFIIGKEVSAFELANGFLPWARQIVLASPRPVQLSVVTKSLVGVRARYVQPYEDHILGGGVIIMNASIDEISRAPQGYRIRTTRSDGGGVVTFDADDVIATTGFQTPFGDLGQLGVVTSGREKIPSQSPLFESISVPNVYFAGTATRGAPGLKKHGLPSSSGAVHGHRYNARILARHIARTHFGVDPERTTLKRDEVLGYVLSEASHAPELWHQKSYLARSLLFNGDRGIVDDGIIPLQLFVDGQGPDGVAVSVEADPKGVIYPAVYVRRDNVVTEHLLAPDPLLDFESPQHRAQLASALSALL
jgi:thioredoxin reductase